MGVAVSGWPLARAVSLLGQLGVVSGTALDVVLARRLQQGDREGHLRRAISAFPQKEVAGQVMADYFLPGGKKPTEPFRGVSLLSLESSMKRVGLIALASFVEVFLAKEGHSGIVGINLLEKIQLPTLPVLFGAMLAGVDYVLMGAGIPRSIPSILDGLAQGRKMAMKLDVAGEKKGNERQSTFCPQEFCGGEVPRLKRPQFLPIVSSATLAITLARKSTGAINGFVVEEAAAGGHNAPPRGAMQLSEKGEPIYGERDLPEIEKIRALGLPFWLAGSYASPERLAQARSLGAAGVQLGTPFAFCRESGIDAELKEKVVRRSCEGTLELFTDPKASPTGFPFKVLQMEGSVSDADTNEKRARICDLGYLRQAYRKPDGSVGYRCPSEPKNAFLHKGGEAEEIAGRLCVCNGLLSAIGLGQQHRTTPEPPLLTAGNDVKNLSRFVSAGETAYSAADVIRHVLS